MPFTRRRPSIEPKGPKESRSATILFANAGLGEFAPLGEITEAHFDKTFGVNVRGLLFTVQKALPLFQDGGSIILNASARSPFSTSCRRWSICGVLT